MGGLGVTSHAQIKIHKIYKIYKNKKTKLYIQIQKLNSVLELC